MSTRIPTPSALLRSPVRFAETFLYVLDKQKRRVRLRYNAAQRDYLAGRTRRDLILKARQLGFSTVIQAEFFRLAVTRTVTTATLAHEDQTTQKLRRMSDLFYKQLPLEDGVRPRRQYANTRLMTYPDTLSEAIIATAGNTDAGRGGTYTHVHGSEVAFWPNAERIVAGIMQGGNPAVVLESTPNGAQGYFYERCMESLDGSPDWKLHFYPWWWDPAYRLPLDEGEVLELTAEEAELVDEHGLDDEQIKWRRAKQRELKHLFIQEYPEDPVTCFLLSGQGYFGDLSGVYTAPAGPERQADHRYVAGLDFGQHEDYTVLVVLDVTAGVMVDMLRINRLPWAVMRARIAEVCRQWHVDELVGETNSLGEPNLEALRDEGLPVTGFTTTNLSKAGLMADLHEALHSGDLVLQDEPALKRELRAFSASQTATGQWRLAAPAGEHDDTVIALGLAWRAALGPGISLGFAEV